MSHTITLKQERARLVQLRREATCPLLQLELASTIGEMSREIALHLRRERRLKKP